jgi:hypothetical protein
MPFRTSGRGLSFLKRYACCARHNMCRFPPFIVSIMVLFEPRFADPFSAYALALLYVNSCGCSTNRQILIAPGQDMRAGVGKVDAQCSRHDPKITVCGRYVKVNVEYEDLPLFPIPCSGVSVKAAGLQARCARLPARHIYWQTANPYIFCALQRMRRAGRSIPPPPASFRIDRVSACRCPAT